MKSKKTIITALILIAAAILMILNGVGVAFGSGIELWRIALGAALLAWLVWVISDKKYHEVFLPLALMFMVFESSNINRLTSFCCSLPIMFSSSFSTLST